MKMAPKKVENRFHVAKTSSYAGGADFFGQVISMVYA